MTVPRLAATVTFAAPSQFACYVLRGQSYVGQFSGDAALWPQTTSQGPTWCE